MTALELILKAHKSTLHEEWKEALGSSQILLHACLLLPCSLHQKSTIKHWMLVVLFCTLVKL